MDPLVVLTFIVVAGMEILFPILVGYWIFRRYRVPWRIFGYGVLFFVIVQIVHTPLVLLTQGSIFQYFLTTFGDPILALAAFSLILGLLAGLFEEIGRYLVFRYFFPSRNVGLTRQNGLQFGAGWGGIESIAIGLLLLLTLFSYIGATAITDEQIQAINESTGGTLTEEQEQAIRAQVEALQNLSPLDLLPSLAERLMAFVLQIAFTLLVLSAVVFEKRLFLILAILFHTIVDAVAVFLVQTAGILYTEAAIFVFALIGLGYIWWIWHNPEFNRGSGDLT